MNKFCFLLLSLLSLTLAQRDFQSSFKAKNSRALEGFVTKSGNITLQKDLNGFYAYVDFAYHYSDASDDSVYDPSLGTVGIALYSSDTILTQSCLDFNEYSCSFYGCSKYSTYNPNYLYFTVDQGYLANTNLYLDYSSWSLSTTHDYATIALTCESNASSTYGWSRYGMIGLGMNGTSANFLTETLFTVSVNSLASTANLLFDSDDVKKSESYYSGTFTTDSNWHVLANDSKILVGDYYSTKFNGNVIFDLDADAIGFPLKFYTSLILALSDKDGLSCNSENYKPFCQFNGKLTDLPVISIELGTQKIEIPPTLYVENVNLSEDPNNIYLENVYLNLKAVDSSLTDQSYVTSAYDNYIILDQNFLNYYFAEFTADSLGENYSISLYTPYEYNPLTPHEIIWPFIVGGVLGIVIIVGIICCIVRACKRRAQTNMKAFQPGPNQAPIVVNDQNVNNYPNYDRDVYVLHQQSQNYWNAPVYSNYQQPEPYSGHPNYPQPGFYNGQPPQTSGNLPGYLPQGTVPTQLVTQ